MSGMRTRGIVWLGLFTFFGLSTILVLGTTYAFEGIDGFTEPHTSPFLNLFIIVLASLSVAFLVLWRKAVNS